MTLNWYVFPEPSGSFAKAAASCSKASGGKYNDQDQLPFDRVRPAARVARPPARRERLLDRHPRDGCRLDRRVRRRQVDPPVARRLAASRSASGVLAGPVKTATWQGKLYAAPINSNTELLWYRKDLVPTPAQDLDPDDRRRDRTGQAGQAPLHRGAGRPVRGSDRVVQLARRLGRRRGSSTRRTRSSSGRRPRPPPTIMHASPTSPAADPSLNVAPGGPVRRRVRAAAPRPSRSTTRSSGSRPQATNPKSPSRWATRRSRASFPASRRTSRSAATTSASRRYSKHPQLAFDAISCLTQPANQITRRDQGRPRPGDGEHLRACRRSTRRIRSTR